MSIFKSAIDDYLADRAFAQTLENPRRSGALKAFVQGECASLVDGHNQLVAHLKQQIKTMEAQIKMMEQKCQKCEQSSEAQQQSYKSSPRTPDASARRASRTTSAIGPSFHARLM